MAQDGTKDFGGIPKEAKKRKRSPRTVYGRSRAYGHFQAPIERILRRRRGYVVIKSITRMIATALLVFWVPSVVSALAQVQTSPFLTVNFFSF